MKGMEILKNNKCHLSHPDMTVPSAIVKCFFRLSFPVALTKVLVTWQTDTRS